PPMSDPWVPRSTDRTEARRPRHQTNGRAVRSAPSFVAQQVLARLEDAVAPVLRGGRGLRGLGLEVGQVGLTEGALDHFEMKANILRQRGVKGIEQGTSELLAGGTGQPAAAP